MNGYMGFTNPRLGDTPCETHPRGRGSVAISSSNLVCVNARRISKVIGTSLQEQSQLPIETRAQCDYDEINELYADKSLHATQLASSRTK
mmetsp:Transcript_48871/g.49224  ORF Transcript_48871/g.49224 Transcript_48871/m.49224 type:complete len:90 (+) Transcript_48871:407-676(+)